ncbi:MAG: hypothetical protein ABEJ61_03285 [Haloferacaceae archaeon]
MDRPRRDRLMPGFLARLADGWRRALEDLLPLALVPMLLAAANTNKVASVLTFDGVHVGFKVGAPVSVVTVWQFVSVPNEGVTVDAGVPVETLPLAVVTVPLLLLVQAGLTAGYFGSIAAGLRTGEYDFLGNVVEHFPAFLVLTAVPVLALLPLALGLFGLGAAGGLPAAGLLFAVALVGFVVAAYLFYATPYLVVLRGTGVVAAARGSYELAVEGGAYFAYFVGFALFVLVVSPVASVVVVDVPVVGLPVGVIAGGVLGLAANVATTRFVADVDPASPDLGSWDPNDAGTDGPPRGA